MAHNMPLCDCLPSVSTLLLQSSVQAFTSQALTQPIVLSLLLGGDGAQGHAHDKPLSSELYPQIGCLFLLRKRATLYGCI